MARMKRERAPAERAPKPGTPVVVLRRARLGQYAGYLGGAALIAAVIALIWGGGINPVVIGALIAAVLGLAAWYAVAPRDFIGFITGRQVRYGTLATFSTLLLIGIVVLSYGLIQRSAITLDMTLAERFTLSPETLRTLERVDRPMQFTGFYGPTDLAVRELDDQILRLYEAATDGLIRRVYIDPEEQPAIAQSFNVTEPAQIFLSYVDEAGAIIPGTTTRVPRGANIEREATNAISRLLVAGSITVYFEISLGERDPLDDGAEGLSGINNGIRESGLITQPLNLVALADSGGEIPADAAAVIFARPLRDLRPVEAETLVRYLDRGGSLLLLADATFNETPFLREGGPFNTYLWDEYGIRARDLVLIDPLANAGTALDVISSFVFTDNPIGGRLDPSGRTPTLFRIARVVEVDLERPLVNRANGRVILSSTASYGETDFARLAETNTYQYDDGQDVPGPHASVVWATDLETGARIVLVGDSDFVTNGQVMVGGNAVLFTDALSWISGLSERVTFAPQAVSVGVPLIFVSPQTINLIGLITIVALPGGVLLTGMLVWARRARRRS
jgi:hypothetical protein